MLQPRGWALFYENGLVYTDAEGTWEEAPTEGVLVLVVYYEPPYRDLFSGGDWYYRREDGSFGMVPTHPEWGEWAPPPEDIPPASMKKAGAASDDDFDMAYWAAFDAVR